MTTPKLDDLLNKIPEIAKAVNEFESAELQQKAFDALMKAAGLDVGKGTTESVDSDAPDVHPKSGSKKSRTKKSTSNIRRSDQNYSIVDVEFHPNDGPSLKEFISMKQPKTDPQRYACLIYYLNNISKEEEIYCDHIYTAFKHLGLKVPNIKQGLNNARVRHGWINIKGSDPISLTRIGENFVEHDLPQKAES